MKTEMKTALVWEREREKMEMGLVWEREKMEMGLVWEREREREREKTELALTATWLWREAGPSPRELPVGGCNPPERLPPRVLLRPRFPPC
jgi:hypothetical protein